MHYIIYTEINNRPLHEDGTATIQWKQGSHMPQNCVQRFSCEVGQACVGQLEDPIRAGSLDVSEDPQRDERPLQSRHPPVAGAGQESHPSRPPRRT